MLGDLDDPSARINDMLICPPVMHTVTGIGNTVIGLFATDLKLKSKRDQIALRLKSGKAPKACWEVRDVMSRLAIEVLPTFLDKPYGSRERALINPVFSLPPSSSSSTLKLSILISFVSKSSSFPFLPGPW